MTVRNSLVLLGGVSVVGLMLFVVGCLCVPAPDAGDKNNPLGPNAACYVCHMTYVKEPLSRVHLKHKVYCIDCHGISAAHANDEDIGATKPDRYYKRGQVNGACRKCHEKHTAAPEKVIKRYIDRKLTKSPAVCTDCHGSHRIKRAKDKDAKSTTKPASGK
ncbi:MAG: cytochrome c3 family protein [Phycisphaerae bacterium]|jgi:predicted CXXCH cytochrome family protein|nr:cytochrome c3 family protein [Phycisphaerae bacterium]